eukprot:281075-Alexandrium_andersonii.AAC.1
MLTIGRRRTGTLVRDGDGDFPACSLVGLVVLLPEGAVVRGNEDVLREHAEEEHELPEEARG